MVTSPSPIAGVQEFPAPATRQIGAGTSGLRQLTDLEQSARIRATREGAIGSVHSWELVTAVDGPGTRLTIFLAGCPLRCLYCHNPDTFEMRRGTIVESDELVKRIKRYRRIFKATGGGITLSGGEVLMQPAFANQILLGAKALGVHTCLDTSGFLGRNASDEFLKNVDMVLLDVKSGIPETYQHVTGRALQPTIDFSDRLHDLGIETWIRFVLVPGLTDAPDNIDAVAAIASRWKGTVPRIEVLPFHQMGRDKWQALAYPYQLADTKSPEPSDVALVREQFRSYGFQVY